MFSWYFSFILPAGYTAETRYNVPLLFPLRPAGINVLAKTVPSYVTNEKLRMKNEELRMKTTEHCYPVRDSLEFHGVFGTNIIFPSVFSVPSVVKFFYT
jgi:hypothetical protein